MDEYTNYCLLDVNSCKHNNEWMIYVNNYKVTNCVDAVMTHG